MDPIKIAAVKGPDGTHLETYDVTELFERAGAALSAKRPADAARDYDQLLKEFPDTRYTKAALYNAGLAYEGTKDWQTAIARFQQAGERARRQLGRQGRAVSDRRLLRRARELADLGDDVRADSRAQGPERRRQDRGDGPARVRPVPAQGPRHRRADVPVGDLLLQQHRQRGAPRHRLLPRVSCATTWARSRTSGSAPSRCGCRRSRWGSTWRTRRACCWRRSASTSRRSSSATRSGRRPPATRSGRCTRSSTTPSSTRPIPDQLLGEANQEKREVYYEELRKRIRILLEKSLRTHEQNLLMLERLGVQNEWRDKSKLAFAKLQRLLDPTYKFEFADPATAGSEAPAPPPPQVPTPPAGHGGTAPRAGALDPRPQGPDPARPPGRRARFSSKIASSSPVRRRLTRRARATWQEARPACSLSLDSVPLIELYVRALRAGLGYLCRCGNKVKVIRITRQWTGMDTGAGVAQW